MPWGQDDAFEKHLHARTRRLLQDGETCAFLVEAPPKDSHRAQISRQACRKTEHGSGRTIQTASPEQVLAHASPAVGVHVVTKRVVT